MKAIVLGEALIDVFADERVVAGAPLNVAADLAVLGWDTRLLTRLGVDADGDRIAATLAALGVDTSLVELDERAPTGTVTVSQTSADHRFTIHAPAAWDYIRGPRALGEHDVLVWGSLASRSSESRAAIKRLTAASSAPLKAFDVNLRPPHVHGAALRQGVANATLVKLNHEEVGPVASHLGLPADAPALFTRSRSLRWVCVTRGPRGALLHARAGSTWSVPAAPVPVVDAVGAGDAFLAGLVDGLARGRDEQAALEQGAAFAAEIVQRRGGLPAPR